ncbi:hypothetical protein M378DRAFT_167801 [Amanita muscaria Koide BX008]|uniref:LIM zinc-binding domain-containing protein n=1 Tax=Amanita muscaria (strain Koide BX008) TaxID=946122 RepID=A0A0C2SCN1_AMAMK|nr:hypothetical protein M378DRAFT_167801 [Amanita muscaria Koide BX008]
MHPFGGIPICPRCEKQVYAAEQVMGPGRKLYHKPCLACNICNKRLDSRTLLEHDQLPYCKTCHIKNFGTRDLRHANLPHREDSLSPLKTTLQPLPLPARVTSPTEPDLPAAPLLRPNRSLATSPNGLRSPTFWRAFDKDHGRDSPVEDPGPLPSQDDLSRDSTTPEPPIDLQQPPFGAPQTPSRQIHRSSHSVGSIATSPGLVPTATGTRYGALLNRSATNGFSGLNSTASPKRWGGDTPACPRCGKSVYFAEQVRAVGKTYHKGCLRCLECNTLLDSSRLRDHDGEPLCVRCYGKLHGPQGSGYALLGKAGG